MESEQSRWWFCPQCFLSSVSNTWLHCCCRSLVVLQLAECSLDPFSFDYSAVMLSQTHHAINFTSVLLCFNPDCLPFKVIETRWEALGSIAWLSHGSSRKPECSLGREVFEWKVWWPYWMCFARSNLHDLPGHWFWLPWLELQVFLMYTIYICIV